MKKLVIFVILLAVYVTHAQTTEQELLRNDKGVLLKFNANSSAGFNFPYLLFIPNNLQRGTETILMVETNNTGVLSDSIEVHEKAAIKAASRSGVGHYVSVKLGLPFLVPVFPRPAGNWQQYTHALDRDTFLAEGSVERLDLQLLAMAADARRQLSARSYPVREKFFITGFSASGTFANRFSVLHPEVIQATASGGINAIVILGLHVIGNTQLKYPLGIADVEKLTGEKVNLAAFSKLPKMLYMGALDDNDAAAFDDAYSKEERAIIYKLFGKSLHDRWQFMEKEYRRLNIAGEFITYPHIGHGTDLKILEEVTSFFRSNL